MEPLGGDVQGFALNVFFGKVVAVFEASDAVPWQKTNKLKHRNVKI